MLVFEKGGSSNTRKRKFIALEFWKFLKNYLLLSKSYNIIK